jgi:hypothetical protein
MSSSASYRSLSLGLLSHTNVGKTTLARTLLQRDVGEVLDQAHVTGEASAHTLIETPAGDRMILWDTPGFGDSVRLVREMEVAAEPLDWIEEQELDRDSDRARFSSWQAVQCVRSRCDVVLYLVNATEYPADAGYVAAEMKILSWIGKPVLVLVNQTGPPREDDVLGDLGRWREHLSTWPIVRKVIGLDAFTRCWVEEGRLLEEVRDLLEGAPRALAEECLGAWRRARQEVFRASMDAIAGELLRAASDGETLVEGAWGNDKQQAMQLLARRMEEGSGAVVDRLISLHGLDGRSTVELRTVLADFATSAEKLAPKRWGVIGGAASGLLGGLGADLASGGLSFGSGMVLGALAGGFGAAAVARAFNTVRGAGGARVRWSDAVLTRTAQNLLLRYLSVAHFGRGRGAWREREAPGFWKRGVGKAVDARQVYYLGAWKEARRADVEPGPGRAGLVALLSGSARDVLAEFYPEARHLIG